MYRWHKLFAADKWPNSVKVVFQRGDKASLEFAFSVPNYTNPLVQDTFAKYLAMALHNDLSLFTAAEVNIYMKNYSERNRADFEEKVNAYLKRYISFYRRNDLGMIPLDRAFEALYQKPFRINVLTENNDYFFYANKIEKIQTGGIFVNKNILSINIGMHKTRIAITEYAANRVRVVNKIFEISNRKFEIDESFYGFIEQLFEYIQTDIRPSLEESTADYFDAISVSIASPTKDGKVLPLPFGPMLLSEYESSDKREIQLEAYIKTKFMDLPVWFENDSNAIGAYVAHKLQLQKTVVLRAGTFLASTYIDENGDMVEMLLPNNLITNVVDLNRPHEERYDNKSYNEIYMRSGHILSYEGLKYLGKASGFQKKYDIKNENELPVKMNDYLLSEDKAKRKDAETLFKQVGEGLAQYIYEMQRSLDIENVFVMGSNLKERAREFIREGFEVYIADNQLDFPVELIFDTQNISAESGVLGAALLAVRNLYGSNKNVQPGIAFHTSA